MGLVMPLKKSSRAAHRAVYWRRIHGTVLVAACEYGVRYELQLSGPYKFGPLYGI